VNSGQYLGIDRVEKYFPRPNYRCRSRFVYPDFLQRYIYAQSLFHLIIRRLSGTRGE
jgi:hypothetical protein